jgi:hypothetical protein
VVAGRPVFHTVRMAGDAVATTFITGADGFLGTEPQLRCKRRVTTGFHFHSPTLEHGLQQVLGALHE